MDMALSAPYRGKTWQEHLSALRGSLPCRNETGPSCAQLVPHPAMVEALARLPEDVRLKIIEQVILPEQIAALREAERKTSGYDPAVTARYPEILRDYLLAASGGYARFAPDVAREILEKHYRPNAGMLRRQVEFVKKVLTEFLRDRARVGVLRADEAQRLSGRLQAITVAEPETSYHLSYNAVYIAKKNSFQMSGLVLQMLPSETARLFLVAHEMAHAVDPVKIAFSSCGIDSPKTLDEVFACREVPAGYRALLDDIASERVLNLKDYPGTPLDYASEAVADYLAAQVVARHLEVMGNGKANTAREELDHLARFACGEDAAKAEGGHPPWRVRFERLIAAHPATWSRVLDCPGTSHFPDWRGVDAR